MGINQILASPWVTEHLEREINFRKSVYQGDIVGRASRLNNVSQKLKIFDEDVGEPLSQSQSQSQLQPQLRSVDMNSKSAQQFLYNTESAPIEKEPTKQSSSRRVSKVATQYSVPTDLVSSCNFNSIKQAPSALSILLQEGIISESKNYLQPSVKKKRIFDENLLSPAFSRQLEKVMGTLGTRQQTDYPLRTKGDFNLKKNQNPSTRTLTEYGMTNNLQTCAHDTTLPNMFSLSRSTSIIERDGFMSLGGSPRVIFQDKSMSNQQDPKKKFKDGRFSFVKSLIDKVDVLGKCRTFQKPSNTNETYIATWEKP